MRAHGRFVSAGRLTNHEMQNLRMGMNFRRYRRQRRRQDAWLWLYTWATVSQDFHPRSEQDWQEHNGIQ